MMSTSTSTVSTSRSLSLRSKISTAKIGKITSILFVSAFAACQTPEPLTEKQAEALIAGAPQLLIGGEKQTLEGLEGFYLNQSEDDAMALIAKKCGKPIVYEGGYRRQNAVFKGCTTPKDPLLHSFRIGFHPDLDNAVFTLEVKRRAFDLSQLRGRFYTELERPFEDLPRPGVVRIRSNQFNLFASSDEGQNAPIHVVFGLNPEKIQKKMKSYK